MSWSPLPCTLLALTLGACAFACQRDEPQDDAKPRVDTDLSSPNARILPAPLASVRGATAEPPPDGRSTAPALLPAAPPRPFSVDDELSPEAPPARDAWLLELRGEFAWPELEARSVELPRGEQLRRAGQVQEPATLSTRPELRLFVSPHGSLTVELASPTLALPVGTQLRSRSDRWGHVIVWPDGRSYRVAPRGSLRALLNERRVDVSPLVAGRVEPGEPGRRFGLLTRRRAVEGPLGRLTLESASVSGLAEGGLLVCRLLLELARIQSSGDVCVADELPVEGHYAWARGGELTFRVTALQRHASVPALESPELFDIPPRMPIFKAGELPPEPTVLLWPPATAERLWGASGGNAGELLLHNPSELPMYVLVDRLPLARVPALGRASWTTQRRGRNVSFRDFLGEHVHPTRVVDVPGELVLGVVPAPSEPTADIGPAGVAP